jgi:hypothetical protein
MADVLAGAPSSARIQIVPVRGLPIVAVDVPMLFGFSVARYAEAPETPVA